MTKLRSLLSSTLVRGLLPLLVVSAAVVVAPAPARGADLTPLPFNLSLVPPLSVNALYRFRTVNAVSLDLLLGDAAALEGLELSGLGSRNGEVRGVQVAGLANWVQSGAYGGSGDARGAQVAGLTNLTGGALRGAQVAGLVNTAGAPSSGVQLAGLANVAPEVDGLQLAGLTNVASTVQGVQLAGLANVAAGPSTVQLALVNVSPQVTGLQLGLVNVAEDADVSVGLVSWVRHGTHDAALAATEYGVLLEADTGGRSVYGILTAGATYGSHPRRYLAGLGLGWRALAGDTLVIDVQGTAMQMLDEDRVTERYLCTARAVAAVRLVGPLSVFAGPTFNVFVDGEPQKIEPVGYGWKVGSDVQLWPGFLAGLRLF
jgi:hypothetical protein